eukprot:115504-Amphidinium_carterae.1
MEEPAGIGCFSCAHRRAFNAVEVAVPRNCHGQNAVPGIVIDRMPCHGIVIDRMPCSGIVIDRMPCRRIVIDGMPCTSTVIDSCWGIGSPALPKGPLAKIGTT